MSARVIRVILTDDGRGNGSEGDPFRRVMQVYSLDGRLLAESDLVKGRDGQFLSPDWSEAGAGADGAR